MIFTSCPCVLILFFWCFSNASKCKNHSQLVVHRRACGRWDSGCRLQTSGIGGKNKAVEFPGSSGDGFAGSLGTCSPWKRGTTVVPFRASTAQKCPSSGALSLSVDHLCLSSLAGKAWPPPGSRTIPLSPLHTIHNRIFAALAPREAPHPSFGATLSL